MAFEINISGEIIPFSYDAEGYINLSDVEGLLSGADGKDVIVNINSPGGDVDEGFLIYTALRKYAAENKAKVTTYAKGRCHSIATVIFLAGDERIANRYLEPFVHNAWTFAMGDAGELQRIAADLEKVNKRIAEFYAEHTDLTYEEAKELMDNDSFIDPDEAVRIRFATKIEEILRPVALKKILNKKTKTVMAKNNDKSFLNKLARVFKNLEGELEVHTDTSETLLFGDLLDGDTPKVGDKATIDGKAAEGEYTLGDGTKYTFEAGVLTAIVEDDASTDDETVEELKEEIAELKTENTELKEEMSALNKKIDGIVKNQKDADKRWNKLKATVSEYGVDDKDNDDKGKKPDTSKKSKGLAGAANKLKTS